MNKNLYLIILELGLSVLISCTKEVKNEDVCQYGRTMWADIESNKKDIILSNSHFNSLVLKVYKGESTIIDGTTDKDQLLEALSNPDSCQVSFYLHVINTILSGDVAIYSDATKKSVRDSEAELSICVFNIFKKYPDFVFRNALKSNDLMSNYEGALVYAFYNKGQNIAYNNTGIADMNLVDFQKDISDKINFRSEEEKKRFQYFIMDIDEGVMMTEDDL